MSQDLIGILSLRDKVTRLIFEPTLDKVFSVFASTMLGTSIVAFFTAYSDPSNIQFIRTNPSLGTFIAVNMVIIVSFVLAAIATLTALFYKRKHEPILKQQDERDKSNKEWNYLVTHRHLKQADITLDKIEDWRKEMDWLRNSVVSLMKYTVERNSITDEERKTIENPEALPALPDIHGLEGKVISASPPITTTDKEIEPKPPEKSITQELNDLENLEI